MRFVLTSTSATGSNVYAGFEDSSANSSRAATLLINPPLPTIVSSGDWASPTPTYPLSYPRAICLFCRDALCGIRHRSLDLVFVPWRLLQLRQPVDHPTIGDRQLRKHVEHLGRTHRLGRLFLFSTRHGLLCRKPFVCPAGDTLTVYRSSPASGAHLSSLPSVTASNPSQTPVTSAITSPAPGQATSTGTTASSHFLAPGWLRIGSSATLMERRHSLRKPGLPRSEFDSDLHDCRHGKCGVLGVVSGHFYDHTQSGRMANGDDRNTFIDWHAHGDRDPGRVEREHDTGVGCDSHGKRNPTPTGTVTLTDGSGYTFLGHYARQWQRDHHGPIRHADRWQLYVHGQLHARHS